MGWDGCRGGPGTDPDGSGWYGMSGMGLEPRFSTYGSRPKLGCEESAEGREGSSGGTRKSRDMAGKFRRNT